MYIGGMQCSLYNDSGWMVHYTDKTENKIFLKNKEIQMGSGAKSYMRKGVNAQIFSPYEEVVGHI